MFGRRLSTNLSIAWLRKRILINRIFDNRRCQILLCWQLKEPLCRAWFGCSPSGYTLSDDYMEFPRAIQMTSRAALKGFFKRQFFGNRRDNTQQNGEHRCFCATIWAQISCRVIRCADSPRVPWLGHFCPKTYVSLMFSLLRNCGQNRPLIKSVASGAARACQNCHRRAWPVSQHGFENAQMMWAAEYDI